MTHTSSASHASNSTHYRLLGLFALLIFFLPMAAFGSPHAADVSESAAIQAWLQDSEFLADEAQHRRDILKDLNRGPFQKALNRVRTREYLIPIGGGQKLFVTETFTLRAWLQPERRAVLFLNGSVFFGNHWSIPVKGYNGTEMAAKRDFFAYTVDYLGSGQSTIPEDGFSIEFEDHVESIRRLIPYIRFFRGVQKVDLVGEGYGGGIATELAADTQRIRSVVQSAVIYREVQGGPLTDQQFIGLISTIPNGYFFSPAEGGLIFLGQSPQGVVDYILETQSGFFPAVTFLAAANRPYFDPSQAMAPGLVLFGDLDFIAVRSDLEQMVEEWGGEATFVANPLAGHAPRVESPEVAAWFWQEVFDFID